MRSVIIRKLDRLGRIVLSKELRFKQNCMDGKWEIVVRRLMEKINKKGRVFTMAMKKKRAAEIAIQKIAEQESVSIDYVRKQIQIAMINGLSSTDPKIKAFWNGVPHKAEIPTPEELITYISQKVITDLPVRRRRPT